MRRFVLGLIPAALWACTSSPSPAPGGEVEVDSIVLERTFCFGTCPAYRLSLTRAGAVHFRSRNPGDSTAATDRVDPAQVAALAREAERIGFWSLPEVIRTDPRLCGAMATDHPGAIVTLYAAARTKRVDDYHGCRDVPPALRRFEARIDSVASSERWVRPADLRAGQPQR
jgi:uncharacterized protein DUF6438